MNGAEFARKAMHEAGVAIVPGLLLVKPAKIMLDLVLQPQEITFLKH